VQAQLHYLQADEIDEQILDDLQIGRRRR